MSNEYLSCERDDCSKDAYYMAVQQVTGAFTGIETQVEAGRICEDCKQELAQWHSVDIDEMEDAPIEVEEWGEKR